MYSYVIVFLDGSKPIWLTISYLRGIPTKEQRGWSSTSRVRCVLRCHAWRCWRLGSAIGSQVNPYRTHRIPVGIPGLLKNVDRKLLKMVIEIVDWPIQNGGSFHSYVSLPVGIFHQLGVWGSHLLSAAPYLGPKDGRSQHGREKRIKTKGWWQSFMDFNGVCKKNIEDRWSFRFFLNPSYRDFCGFPIAMNIEDDGYLLDQGAAVKDGYPPVNQHRPCHSSGLKD